jgi:hypothetical protein
MQGLLIFWVLAFSVDSAAYSNCDAFNATVQGLFPNPS